MGLPKGMTKPVVSLWKAIDKYVTRELKRIGDSPGKSAIGHLNPRTDFLGQGMWGSVYETTCPRWVLKLTADPTEGPITGAIMRRKELHDHPGVAFFLKQWRLGKPALYRRHEYTIYVVLRENIIPRPVGYRASRDERRAEVLLVGGPNDNGLRGTSDALNDALIEGDRSKVERYGMDVYGALLELANLYPSHQMANFMDTFLSDVGGALADVHLGNFGFRRHYLNDLKLSKDVKETHEPDEYWVLFDPGHSSVAEKKEPPLMPLRNPGPPPDIIV